MAERAMPVGTVAEIGLCSRSILQDLAHRLFRRRQRRRDQVLSDYDRGEWAQQLEARNWERAGSLAAYAEKSWVDRDIICTVDGRLWRMPVTRYYRIRYRTLADILRRFAGDADELVEVGSGTGTNLFALAADKSWPKLLGLELSATGRTVARRIAAHFGVEDRVSFDEIDLLDAGSPGFRLLEGKAAFSYLCLEQLPNDTEKVMRNLCAAKVKRMIHVESSFELLSPLSLRDLASMSYVWRQDYQRTIVSTARRLEAEGLIRIIAAERLHFSPSWRNTPTLVVWEPA
jgi:hypothetical protein